MKKTAAITLLISYALLIFGQHTPDFAIPNATIKGELITHMGYTLWYNEQHEQAAWVAYELTANETQKMVKRSNKFRKDNAVTTGSASNADYLHSGYDRGHLAPAADMAWSAEAMSESFYYSNMSPQVPGFNRGIWKSLEELVRTWAIENTAIFVVTGPIFENKLPTIGPNKVSVPRYFYKVILDYTPPTLKGIGFILPNAASSEPLQQFAVPIDSLEQVTGINFFPTLPHKQEKELESTICLSCWSWKNN